MTQSRQSISRLFGVLKYNGPPVTLEDMEKAMAKGAAQRYLRAIGSSASLNRTLADNDSPTRHFHRVA